MNINKNTRKLAFFGIMLAIISVLSFIEHMMPPIPLMPPNIKLGLSNIVTMYCLFFVGKKDALMLTCLKSTFVFLIRGPIAAVLSLSGGILSILTIIAFMLILKNISYLILSVFGAISHNIGQIVAASVLLKFNLIMYYFPISIVVGIIMGVATGTLLKVTIPLFNRIER